MILSLSSLLDPPLSAASFVVRVIVYVSIIFTNTETGKERQTDRQSERGEGGRGGTREV